MRLRALLLTLLVAGASCAAYATTDEEIEAAVRAAREAPKNHALNRNAAEMLRDAGRYREAVAFYLKSDNAGNLGAAECLFYLYDYDEAETYLDKYLEKRTKAEAAKDKDFSYGDGTETIDWTDHLRSRIELGRSMLDRVEQLQIVDSINVPADEFFKFMRLSASAGHLADAEHLESLATPEMLEAAGVTDFSTPAFVSERGDDVVWYGATASGDSKMLESVKLTDGTWDLPVTLFDYQKIFGNRNGSWVAYPFLMADGVTLYFAADGEGSLGELDIFISRRDGDTFLQPSNVGMPYNSPFNDYMLAIDELTGIGWWATDRNQLRDSVTLYAFIPQDLRINYPSDTPGLTDLARVASVAATQKGDVDYEAIRRRLAAPDRSRRGSHESDFTLALPGGRVATRISDLHSAQGRTLMKQYLSELASMESLRTHLADLRLRYAKGDKGVAAEILDAEKALEGKRLELKRLHNQIASLEER